MNINVHAGLDKHSIAHTYTCDIRRRITGPASNNVVDTNKGTLLKYTLKYAEHLVTKTLQLLLSQLGLQVDLCCISIILYEHGRAIIKRQKQVNAYLVKTQRFSGITPRCETHIIKTLCKFLPLYDDQYSGTQSTTREFVMYVLASCGAEQMASVALL